MSRVLLPVFRELETKSFPDIRTALGHDPARWLPPSGQPDETGGYEVVLEAGPASRVVTCHVGAPWQVGEVLWRGVRLVPNPQSGVPGPIERLLPTFVGAIGVRPVASGAELVLHGDYDVPAGVVGAVADAWLLHRVAEATAEAFVSAVASRLVAATPVRTG